MILRISWSYSDNASSFIKLLRWKLHQWFMIGKTCYFGTRSGVAPPSLPLNPLLGLTTRVTRSWNHSTTYKIMLRAWNYMILSWSFLISSSHYQINVKITPVDMEVDDYLSVWVELSLKLPCYSSYLLNEEYMYPFRLIYCYCEDLQMIKQTFSKALSVVPSNKQSPTFTLLECRKCYLNRPQSKTPKAHLHFQ